MRRAKLEGLEFVITYFAPVRVAGATDPGRVYFGGWAGPADSTILNRSKWSLITAVELHPIPEQPLDSCLDIGPGVVTAWRCALSTMVFPRGRTEPYPLRIWVPPRQTLMMALSRFPREAELPELTLVGRFIDREPQEEPWTPTQP